MVFCWIGVGSVKPQACTARSMGPERPKAANAPLSVSCVCRAVAVSAMSGEVFIIIDVCNPKLLCSPSSCSRHPGFKSSLNTCSPEDYQALEGSTIESKHDQSASFPSTMQARTAEWRMEITDEHRWTRILRKGC